MPRCRSSRSAECGLLFAALTSVAATAWSAEPPAASKSTTIPLQLEVLVNGHKIGLIGSFTADDGNRVSATPSELKSLGLRLEGAEGDAPIPLDAIKSLRYTYDPETQSIDVLAPDELLIPKEIGPSPAEPAAVAEDSMVSLVVNYSLVGSLYDATSFADGDAKQALETLTLDSKLSGPFGVFANSGFIGQGTHNEGPGVRLDTVWSLSNPDDISTIAAGDIINGGLVWTRPVRLGGVQLRRDFSTRPDLITAPMPTLSGSAAVPSSVDVFIENVKSFSRDVEPGPFTISNLPTIGGSGTVKVVVKDAMGHETVREVDFYQTSSLLKQGLFDYAIDAGFARRGYGLRSFAYDDKPVGSLSLRYGYFDDLTLETHFEAGIGLANGGAGATFTLFDKALVTAGATVSQDGNDQGAQGYLSFQTKILGLGLNLSSRRTFGTYRDLASVLGARSAKCSAGKVGCDLGDFSVPTVQNSATVSFDIPDDNGSVSLSGIEQRGSVVSRIVSASYSRPFIENSSLVVSGFREVNSGETGVFAGLSMPFGELGQAQLGYQLADGRSGLSAAYGKPISDEPGSFGWTASATQGSQTMESASLDYRSSVMKTQLRAEQTHDVKRVLATVDGALVATPSGIYLSNTIAEGFAVVNAGAPGVDVLLENRKVATTGADGTALVPGLRPFQKNRVAIDSTQLPADMISPDVATITSPFGKSGVVVDFKAKSVADSAVVVFRRGNDPLPAGTRGTLKGREDPFVIGYDGRAYLEHLDASNTVAIETEGTPCEVSFQFQAISGRQQVIEAPPCP